MTTKDLIQLFPLKENCKDVTTSAISSIINDVDMESGICDNGIDYYFRINLSDLAKSDISDEIYKEMAQNGWYLSKNRKFIELIY